MSVSWEERVEVVFCEARRRDRIVWVVREDMMVVAWVLRWVLRV